MVISELRQDKIQRDVEALAPGDQLSIPIAEGLPRPHVFVVMACRRGAFHTGRRQYLVACSTCESLVAPRTTGPVTVMIMHVHRSGS